MQNSNNSECNGPMQINDETSTDKSWKCKDTKNGYIKTENREESVGPLLSTMPVATVVQVSGTGAKTMVVPGKRKPTKEKFLLVAVLVLLLFSVICLLLLIGNNSKRCTKSNGMYLIFDHVNIVRVKSI